MYTFVTMLVSNDTGVCIYRSDMMFDDNYIGPNVPVTQPYAVKFTRLDANAILQEPRTGDVGYDLVTVEDVVLPALSVGSESRLPVVKVRTGIALEMPGNVWARILDRSSMSAGNSKLPGGLVTVAGVVDPGYRGEIIVAMMNMSHVEQTLECGTKVAQLVFLPAITPSLTLADSLSDTERGAGGFGSTGAKSR